MFEQIPESTLIEALIFTFISIAILIFQILFKKRYQFLKLCKTVILIPLAVIFIDIATSAAEAFTAIARANDLSNAVIEEGIATMLFSLTLGVYITIFLAVLYGVTAAIYENQE